MNAMQQTASGCTGGSDGRKDRRLRIVLLMLLSLLLIMPATAATKKQVVSQGTFRVLQQAERLSEKKQHGKAIKALQRQLARAREKSYESAVLLRSIAVMYLMQDKLKPAADHLQRSLDTGALSQETAHKIQYDLATLYMATGRYAKVISVLGPWLKAEPKPSADAYILLTNAHVQLKQYAKAVRPLKKAIAKKRKPPETWLQLLLGLHHELKSYREATKVLHRLIALYEKGDYWLQLAGVHQLRRQLSTATSTLRLARERGFITRQEQLHRLASLHLYLNMPFEAGQLMQTAIDRGELKADRKTLRLLANSWLRARENDRAAAVLERMARRFGDAETLVSLGRIHLSRGRWKQAAAVLGKAMKKKGLRNPETVRSLLEIARFELDAAKATAEAINLAENQR